MLNLKYYLFAFIGILNGLISVSAQNHTSDSIIFSIDDKVVYQSELLSQYQKNNNSNFQADRINLEDYAKLFLKFKLKVKAAEDKGLDTLPKFLKEFESYRKQLADKYISNGKVTEDMVKETYRRMTNEINASHILLTLKADANPSDTLETYNKAIDILKKIDDGENFEELALTYSQDPSVRINNGNLGWFKAFKMVYPFETVAYNLDTGEVSQPVRTQFGYHIIKKNAERKSKGKIVVAHIMKNLKSKDSSYQGENEINLIYKKVKQGENFMELAKQFSDHKTSASNGGKLSPFGVGDLNSQQFEDIAFSLDKNDSISKPFKTQFGWHIIKYLDNVPVQPLENMKSDIISKIKTTDRSKRLIENIKKDLKQKYDVNVNYELLSLLEERIDESILRYKWVYTEKEGDDEWILKVDKNHYDTKEFLEYIEKQQRSINDRTISKKLYTAMDDFTYSKLVTTHNKNLENLSPEFAAEIKTYYEGLLLFEIMETEVWKPIQNDSLKLKKYFENNWFNFKTPVKINGILASSSSSDKIIDIKKEIDQTPLTELKENYPEVIFKSLEEINIDDSSLPKEIILQEGLKKNYMNNGQYICILINKVIPSKEKKFEEVRGEIINILQKEREDKWIDELSNKYNISINNRALKKLENKIEN